MKAAGGINRVGCHLVRARIEVDRHDLAAMVLLDLRPDALVELMAAAPGLFSANAAQPQPNDLTGPLSK